jgi:O-antigen ligase
MATPPVPLPSRVSALRRLGPTESQLVAAAGAIAAVAISALVVLDLKLGLAAVIGLCIVPIALLRIQVAVCIWIVVLFFSRVSGLTSIPNHLEQFIVACWIGLLIDRRPSVRSALAEFRPLIVLAVVFATWEILTLAWAPDPGSNGGAVKDLIYSPLGLMLVLGTIRERKHFRWLATAFVAGATLTVLYGVAKGGLSASGATSVTNINGRLQAGQGDPNYLAAVIVPAIMLAVGLASGRPRRQQALLAASIFVLAIGLAATQSRGGLIAAGVAAGGALVIWRGQRFAVATLLLFAAAVTGGFFLADPSDFTRIQTSNGGSGRSNIWQVAFRILHAHPFFGIGLGQFPNVSPNYVRAPGALDYVAELVQQHIVVHNVYLQLWVETGIPGVLLYFAIVTVAVTAGWRAILAFVALGDREMTALARCSLLATFGMLSASFFLSDLGNRQDWVLLALGPVLAGIAQRERALSAAALEPIWAPLQAPVLFGASEIQQ